MSVDPQHMTNVRIPYMGIGGLFLRTHRRGIEKEVAETIQNA